MVTMVMIITFEITIDINASPFLLQMKKLIVVNVCL